ncbi:sphingolipid 4-desaturase/C4-monooxygenase, partial [Paragonimus westermani]
MVNLFVQLAFNYFVVSVWGWKPLIYLLSGTLLAMGVHPVAGHFISEHFVFDKQFETYSYYGILNMVTFNVGYHVEHHDFPYIPGSRLYL